MKILSLTTLTTVAATAAAQKYIDECSQYPTCAACLDVGQDALNAEGTGLLETAGNLTTRPNCGWCHFNIQYADGTTGARCAGVRGLRGHHHVPAVLPERLRQDLAVRVQHYHLQVRRMPRRQDGLRVADRVRPELQGADHAGAHAQADAQAHAANAAAAAEAEAIPSAAAAGAAELVHVQQ